MLLHLKQLLGAITILLPLLNLMKTNECLNCGKPLHGQGDGNLQVKSGLCNKCWREELDEMGVGDEDRELASKPEDIWKLVEPKEGENVN